MKHCILILTLFSIVLFNACKKKSDDVQPGSASQYLLDKIVMTDSSYTKIIVSTEYTYDAEGRYEQIFHKDGNGTVVGIESYHYNAAGLVSDYYASSHNVLNIHYTFTYNSNNLVTLRKGYSSPDFRKVSSTLVYTYNADHTVNSYLYKDSIITDSAFFAGYTNGRPASELRYYTSNTDTSITRYRFTYDARMNRILTEQSMPHDTTTFYDAIQNTFVPYSFMGSMGIVNVNPDPNEINEDMNPSSRNKDTDLEASSATGFNCGILEKTSLQIEDEISGQPFQRIGNYYQSFNCGTPEGYPGLSNYSLYSYKSY